MIVPMVQTRLTDAEIATELRESYLEETGEALPARLGRFALAVVAIENDHGRAIYDHNWGNVSGDNWPGDKYENPGWEPGKPVPRYFRAYATHRAGARAWWRLMLDHYPSVVARGLGGNYGEGVTEMYRLHYVVPLSSGEEEHYRATVVGLARSSTFAALFPESAPMRPMPDATGAVAGIAGLFVVTILEILRRSIHV